MDSQAISGIDFQEATRIINRYVEASQILANREKEAEEYEKYCQNINEFHICRGCKAEYGDFNLCYEVDNEFDSILGRSIKTVIDCPLCRRLS